MKIKKLIEIFEELLEDYEKAQGLNEKEIFYLNMGCGFCYYYRKKYNSCKLYTDIFYPYKGYYSNHLNRYGSLFEDGDIKSRVEWLKKEIPNLKKLLKNGYTDV